MWDLSSQIRDGSCVPCTRKWMLNHWTTREVPNSYHLFKFKSCLKDPPKFPFTKSFANIYSAPISSCANRKKQNLCPWEVQGQMLYLRSVPGACYWESPGANCQVGTVTKVPWCQKVGDARGARQREVCLTKKILRKCKDKQAWRACGLQLHSWWEGRYWAGQRQVKAGGLRSC